MSGKYIFDKEDFSFKKEKPSRRVIVRRAITAFVVSVSLAIVYYFIFALFFSTEEEERLSRENQVYEDVFEGIGDKSELLADVIDGLQVTDDRIYEELFQAPSPHTDPSVSIDLVLGIDNVAEGDIVRSSAERLASLENKVAYIDSCLAKVVEGVQRPGFVMPPMDLPLKNFSFAQTGASVGMKINPIYKVPMNHEGIDLIAFTGDPVHAAADGVVSSVTMSRKGLGNVVTIKHQGGYVTKYAHLADIKVSQGQKVKRGAKVGYVGISGNSFIPHLHYEVIKDGKHLDPAQYFYASVDPHEYVNILIMSASAEQSLD